MAASGYDPPPRRFVVRRVASFERRDGAVVLNVVGQDDEGVIEGAELAVSVPETGAVRLTFGPPHESIVPVPFDPAPALAPLAVTTSDASLHLASERHARFGPDPEDVTVEIGVEPFTLAVVDAAGRQVVRLADADGAGDVQPLTWTPDGMVGVSFALEPDERLYGLDARPGPLDRVGSTLVLDSPSDGHPLGRFLLSGRGYGLFVQAPPRLTAELGTRSRASYTLTIDGSSVDLFIFPATWPRAALAACAGLVGRASLPPSEAFSATVTDSLTPTLSHGEREPTAPPLPLAAEGAGGWGPKEALQEALAFGLAVPGRWHEDISLPPALSRESFVRWAQWRLLSPFAALPTAPDDAAQAIVDAYARLRQRLLPYLLHCARETAQQGLPMLRPLVLEFSWDDTAAAIDDQYLLGRDLLVAPIFSEEPGVVPRSVYLPRYANWYDWWTGDFFEGGQWVETTSPLERLPLYVRAGTAIPLADPPPSDAPLDVTRLLLFAPRDGAIGASIELAEGDMLGVEHERGAERSRIYVEGLPPTVREIEIVGLSPDAQIVDAASPRVRIVPSDASLPGLGGRWDSVSVALDVGAYTTGLELRW
jgi:hypothetical protein